VIFFDYYVKEEKNCQVYLLKKFYTNIEVVYFSLLKYLCRILSKREHSYMF